MKKAPIVILVMLLALSAAGILYMTARAEKKPLSWRVTNPCFDNTGKWYTR